MAHAQPASVATRLAVAVEYLWWMIGVGGLYGHQKQVADPLANHDAAVDCGCG
ncbi:hypothetical protein [Croceicoccus marinus]|uniref:Uncharacterized protein n=1 Tax=Croceicoccus marinus TaxID=450378 RepID=A0A7G6VUJ5_9SPHN|nr:hypothetical protein [Croceicoccus marinus]QNE05410.1 hypothetical protein H4O24_01485 [Croceicoccus marinus]